MLFRSDDSLYQSTIAVLDKSVDDLNRIYLSLKRIAGTSTGNKQWDPESDFPGITEQIQEIYNTLNNLSPHIYEVNGSDVNFQALIYLRSALSAIKGVLKDPRDIPNQYAKSQCNGRAGNSACHVSLREFLPQVLCRQYNRPMDRGLPLCIGGPG